MSSPPPIISFSSPRPRQDLEDTLIFGEDFQLVKDWCDRQSCDGSTAIKTIQLRNEYVVPFHQFIVVQTRGEFCRAYRVDRGREREGWSVFDTTKKLGVPPRDTIALLQEPVGELEKTSQCSMELHCSDDKAIDLFFVLSIGFRIHNTWGTRYNLLIHNCYFFARTIINTCDDRLGKESSSSKNALERVLGKLYRGLPLLLWASLLVSVLVLRLAHIRSFPGEFGVGIVFGVVNALVTLLALMQVYVALAVRVVVAEVVQRERELEQGKVLEVEWELSKLLEQMPGIAVLGMLLLAEGVNLMTILLPYKDSDNLLFFIATALIMFVVLLVLFPFLAWKFSKNVLSRARSGRLLNIRTEDSGIVRVTAAAEPEQELGVELAATRRPARQSDVGATVATDQDSDNRCGAAVGAGSGIELEQEQGIHV
ncbi:hypothetical protein L208DRAFT_1458617 [Tricholoma matsutake]|nr:hypothetical protein L208DRAFT_1458617 [Tricholoma matsutake 945]